MFPLHHVHEAGENKTAQETARRLVRVTIEVTAPTHHPRRNPQESNLLPTGLQPVAHPHELEFPNDCIASRREESNLHHVVPNHACSRYTTSSCATPS